MKIHKINKEGTIAIVIPKDMAKMLNWKEGQDVMVNMTQFDYKLTLVNRTLLKETKDE
jgi:antitoxin component of MazEF toxin-antitoxin module